MRNSKEIRALYMLSNLKPASNAILFYDNTETMERYLFNYVKAGLRRNERVIYLAGIRTIKEVEDRMIKHRIDCEHYKKKGMLFINSYDNVFLVDGRVEPKKYMKDLYSIVNNSKNVRVAGESNWWLLADLFENVYEIEGMHTLLPHNLSTICSYNLADLIKYVSMYHLAKLMELHEHSLAITRDKVMLSDELYSYLGKCILATLESLNYIPRIKYSKLISEVLRDLEMQIGSKIIELEKGVEDKISQILRLDIANS